MKNIIFFYALLATMFIYSCDIKKNTIEPYQEFTKIYNTDSVETSYHTLDIKEMPDGGFIILAYTDKGHTYLLRTDNEGITQWGKSYSSFTNPLPSLLYIGNEYYFFCLSENFSEGTVIVKVDDALQEGTAVTTLANGLRPLSASVTNDGGCLLLNYDSENERTVLLKLSSNFQPDGAFDEDGRKDYEVQLTDVLLDKLNNHIFRLDAPLPFLCGQLNAKQGGNFYFNGYFRSDLSLVFVDAVSGTPVKRLTGFQYQKCVSSITDLEDAISYTRFEYANNFITPLLSLDNINSISNLSDFKGIPLPEVSNKGTFKGKLITLKGKKVILNGTDTKGNTIALMAYDAKDGNYLGTKYLGQRFPHQIGNFIQTSDGGLAIGVRTMATGRFARIGLIKLSKEEADAIIP